MRSELLKFIGFFFLSYLFCILILTQSFLSNSSYAFIRSMVVFSVKAALPSAHIEGQIYKDISTGQIDHSSMYLVYGNPYLVQKAIEDARAAGLSEVSVPTKSVRFKLFEMFLVPLFFLISIFLATNIQLKTKWKGLVWSLLILGMFLFLRCIFLVLYHISSEQIGIYELSESAMGNLSWLVSVFTLGFNMSLAFILWLIFGFRKSSFVNQFLSLFNTKQL
ncbi:MAG: hypothetical protein IPM48_00495 [Saprospiraceae bacterium]|nr:hypothetical protein [Saprospiraceae bacterium]